MSACVRDVYGYVEKRTRLVSKCPKKLIKMCIGSEYLQYGATNEYRLRIYNFYVEESSWRD